MRVHASNPNAAILLLPLVLAAAVAGCSGALEPRQTPQRVVLHFLKEAGRRNPDGAAQWTTPEAASQIESWIGLLFFPEVSHPATEEEGETIDRFIGLFYRVTTMSETETEAEVHLIFSATDAILEYPSVANQPMLPNVAQFMVTLVRQPSDSKEGEWKISNLEPLRR